MNIAKEWLQLVPFLTSLGLVGYISYREIDYYLHFKQNTKVKNMSLTSYLQFVPKSVDQMTEKDVKILLQCPIEYKPGCRLEYGRYGFYSRQEKLSRQEILIILEQHS